MSIRAVPRPADSAGAHPVAAMPADPRAGAVGSGTKWDTRAVREPADSPHVPLARARASPGIAHAHPRPLARARASAGIARAAETSPHTTSDVRTVYCEARYTCVPVSTKAPVSS
ncbi:hypothetical protein GCM10023215_47450 [Pseudonocardia yuanmonensis]|uniref:Uncharacterized protein n=1 Tax=Pseudonocardia yuanmonensis TaxID=1095914 RepID=A0ABP8XBX3_9PSEU